MAHAHAQVDFEKVERADVLRQLEEERAALVAMPLRELRRKFDGRPAVRACATGFLERDDFVTALLVESMLSWDGGPTVGGAGGGGGGKKGKKKKKKGGGGGGDGDDKDE